MFTRTVNLSVWLGAAALLLPPSLFATGTGATPQRFDARVGGFLGYTYQVQLQDGLLQYARFGGGHKPTHARVRPTMEQWTEFRRELDAIDIWRWRAQYVNLGVTDGTQWSLDVAFRDRAIKTQGSNEYPGTMPDFSGGPSASEAFTRYLKAVQRLVGGRVFE